MNRRRICLAGGTNLPAGRIAELVRQCVCHSRVLSPGITLLTVSFQVIKAALANPVNSLQRER